MALEDMPENLTRTAAVLSEVTGYLTDQRPLPLPNNEETTQFVALLKEFEGTATAFTAACFAAILQPEVTNSLLKDIDIQKKALEYIETGRVYPNRYAIVLSRYSDEAGIYLETREPACSSPKNFTEDSEELLQRVRSYSPIKRIDTNRWGIQKWTERNRELYVASLHLKPEDLGYNPNLFLRFVEGVGFTFLRHQDKILDEKLEWTRDRKKVADVCKVLPRATNLILDVLK